MQLILTVLHLFLALGLIGLILIQHGRGADAGAAFGSGASSTVFGARGSASFLTRSTAALATVFFLTSMALAYFAAQVGEPKGLMDEVQVPAPVEVETEGPAAAEDAASDLPPGALPADEDVPVDVPSEAEVPVAREPVPVGDVDEPSGSGPDAAGEDDVPVAD